MTKEHTEKWYGIYGSPFEEALDILKEIAKVLKMPQESANHKLLEEISKTGKFLSTELSSWAETDKALEILKEKTTIMQCSSIYPCPEEKCWFEHYFGDAKEV